MVSGHRLRPCKVWWICILLLLGLLFCCCSLIPGVYASSSSSSSSSTSRSEGWRTRRKLARIHRHLSKITKPAVKSIQVCVCILSHSDCSDCAPYPNITSLPWAQLILLCRRFKVSSTCLLLKTNKPALESWQTATFSGLLVSVVWNFLLTSKVQYIFCANLCFETNDTILCFVFFSMSNSCVFNQSRYQQSSSLGRKKLSIIKLRLA